MIVAAVCCRYAPGGLQVLLVRTADGTRWTFPKGSARADEARGSTALRELAEQTGWRGKILSPTLFHMVAPAGLTGFLALAIAPAGRVGTGAEGRVPSWFSLSVASEKLAQNRAAALAERLQLTLNEAAALFRQQEEFQPRAAENAVGG